MRVERMPLDVRVMNTWASGSAGFTSPAGGLSLCGTIHERDFGRRHTCPGAKNQASHEEVVTHSLLAETLSSLSATQLFEWAPKRHWLWRRAKDASALSLVGPWFQGAQSE